MPFTPLDCTTATGIYQQIRCSRLEDLRTDLFAAAVRYAQLRVRAQQADATAYPQADADRTRAHNVFIDTVNILARNMAKIGEDTAWQKTLGEERKAIGDLACYMNCFLGLAAR